MATHAQFWAIDLHTHTPASRDVNVDAYGASTAEEFVQAALDAGLDAVAITDHNTSSWCDEVAEAAKGTRLLVLPGVEISTTEGHLLAIWEEGTPSAKIDELLVQLGISGEDQGKLDISAEVGFAEAAKRIAAADGLAIAAHIDRPRGLLVELTVAHHLRRTLATEDLCAVEVVDLDTVERVRAKVADTRHLGCVRGSDTTEPGRNIHVVQGLGNRRTWIKASRPDLIGLKHALMDPDLRVRLNDPSSEREHPVIESVSLSGGFLDGSTLDFSPDLNCLLGGTGAGKSLVLEAVRFALGQQVDASAFPQIWNEVRDRLVDACGATGVVSVVVTTPTGRFLVERVIGESMDGLATISQDVGGEWTEVDLDPFDVVELSAFSQGEVLEYSRQPVGRMALVDSGIDLTTFDQKEVDAIEHLAENGRLLLAQRALVHNLETQVKGEAELTASVETLSKLFKSETVKEQESWTSEHTQLDEIATQIPDPADFAVPTFDVEIQASVESNRDLFERAAKAMAELEEVIAINQLAIARAIEAAESEVAATREAWDKRFGVFKVNLDAELREVEDGASLVSLRTQLERLQRDLATLTRQKVQLAQIEGPRLDELTEDRERLLERLQDIRKDRRQARRERVDALNAKTAGIVKMDIPASPDRDEFRSHLANLKVGSRVREDVLDSIAAEVHPFSFARAMLNGDVTELASDNIDAASMARLLANIEDRDLWEQLLEAQCVPMCDRLEIKFKKPDDGQYASIESLAHGQRCTAVLVALLADGNNPVVVDQPEDALHAPWIEEYLVDRLRSLRGGRQYVFATRSPGIVVGADAEQIITMRATAGRGEVEATGSLERHDLNKLALHHLEGGPSPFRRRSVKLEPSVRPLN